MTMKKELPCTLTSEERHVRSERLARVRVEVRALKDERKVMIKDFKGRLDPLDAEDQRLAAQVTTGVETRLVDVEEIKIFETGTYQLKRIDTGEIIEERAMTAKERDVAAVDVPDAGGEARKVRVKLGKGGGKAN